VVGVAVVLIALAFGHRLRLVALLVGLLVGMANLVDVVGTWDLTAERGIIKVAELASPAAAVLLVAVCLWRLAARPLDAQTLVGLVATALWSGIALGVTRLNWLSASQIPFDLPALSGRLATAGSLGAAVGGVAAAFVGWRRSAFAGD
jgi:hypothetical protein